MEKELASLRDKKMKMGITQAEYAEQETNYKLLLVQKNEELEGCKARRDSIQVPIRNSCEKGGFIANTHCHRNSYQTIEWQRLSWSW